MLETVVLRATSLALLISICACERTGCSPTVVFDGAAASPLEVGSDASTLGGRPLEEDWEVVDPYCGMRLRRSEAAATARHRGLTYYFCMADHQEAFLRDPDRYLTEELPEGEGGEIRRPTAGIDAGQSRP